MPKIFLGRSHKELVKECWKAYRGLNVPLEFITRKIRIDLMENGSFSSHSILVLHMASQEYGELKIWDSMRKVHLFSVLITFGF